MEPETQIQYISLDGLPSVAAEITAEQRGYNPLLDEEFPCLEFEAILFRAGLPTEVWFYAP